MGRPPVSVQFARAPRVILVRGARLRHALYLVLVPTNLQLDAVANAIRRHMCR